MPRAVSNVPRLKRKKQIMQAAKGAYGARSKLWGPAKETVERAWRYAYRDRKNKKREFRKLWIVRINAAAHQHGMSYSVFMAGMKAAGLEIDRKISPTSPCATRRRSRRSPVRCARRSRTASSRRRPRRKPARPSR
jgi:large subunit ribosomal protein L20